MTLNFHEYDWLQAGSQPTAPLVRPLPTRVASAQGHRTVRPFGYRPLPVGVINSTMRPSKGFRKLPDGIWVIVTVGYVVLAVLFLITLVWSRIKTGTLRRTLGKGQALLVVGAAVLFLVSVTALILIATGSLRAMSTM
jgi:hypothetical protein